RAVGQRDVLGERPAEHPRLEVVALARFVRLDVFDPQTTYRPAGFERVLVVDDELLRDVDETTREVARVSSTKRGVDEALAGARRGDEVLEHVEAFTE